MAGLIHRLLIACCAAVVTTAAFALEIVAEGEAVIENDDVPLARQLALRRAMASAVEQAGGMLQSTTVSTSAGIQERTSLSSRSQVLGARVASEYIEKDKLKLVAEVRLADAGQASRCTDRPLRKALVTAFPLQVPEQLGQGEYTGWPSDTAEHLERTLNTGGQVLGAAAATKVPFVLPYKGPELERRNGVPVLAGWAQNARAQYVVSGVFVDFGKSMKAFVLPQRHLTVDAYIFDGISGEIVARQEFTRVMNVTLRLPRYTVFGSKEFRNSNLGETYLDLMAELARWVENNVACMPFSARVLKAEGRMIYLNVGTDSGIEPGMELLLTRESGNPVASLDGESLGRERRPVAGLVVKSVFPRYSVAEITAKKTPPPAQPGDIVFGL